MKKKFSVFYKPTWIYLLMDICLLLISAFIVLEWFPLSTQLPFDKYDKFIFFFSVLWVCLSYLCHRYVPIRFLHLLDSLYRMLATAASVFVIMYGYMIFGTKINYSIYVLSAILLVVIFVNIVDMILVHAYNYALDAEPEIERTDERGPEPVMHAPQHVDDISAENISRTIVEYSSEKVLEMLTTQVDLYSTNTHVLATTSLFNFSKLPYYRYDALVNMMPLNQIRGINKMFGTVNDRLPDNGLFVCCFEPQSVRKKRFFDIYPPVINFVFYSIDFLFRRFLPKIFFTSRLYFDMTGGKDRVLSKTEVLGRLCYCGFDIVDEQKVHDKVYVVARRAFRPKTVRRRVYGILVKLNRVGKNGKVFTVYKMRTMHPYSEYLQAYIYEKNSLQEGGKFNHDIRVTTLGRLMRKYWLDEVPMFINLLKGDMKLVGVRPISQHYFSLYSKELQEKRTHFKPGMLPPFYADMPKTLPEIEASEMKYLVACEQHGVLRTDWAYLWKIVGNILFKKARSK